MENMRILTIYPIALIILLAGGGIIIWGNLPTPVFWIVIIALTLFASTLCGIWVAKTPKKRKTTHTKADYIVLSTGICSYDGDNLTSYLSITPQHKHTGFTPSLDLEMLFNSINRGDITSNFTLWKCSSMPDNKQGVLARAVAEQQHTIPTTTNYLLGVTLPLFDNRDARMSRSPKNFKQGIEHLFTLTLNRLQLAAAKQGWDIRPITRSEMEKWRTTVHTFSTHTKKYGASNKPLESAYDYGFEKWSTDKHGTRYSRATTNRTSPIRGGTKLSEKQSEQTVQPGIITYSGEKVDTTITITEGIVAGKTRKGNTIVIPTTGNLIIKTILDKNADAILKNRCAAIGGNTLFYEPSGEETPVGTVFKHDATEYDAVLRVEGEKIVLAMPKYKLSGIWEVSSSEKALLEK